VSRIRIFYLNADPDPGSQTNADPDPGQTLPTPKVEFIHEKYTVIKYTYVGTGTTYRSLILVSFLAPGSGSQRNELTKETTEIVQEFTSAQISNALLDIRSPIPLGGGEILLIQMITSGTWLRLEGVGGSDQGKGK
jgi:hypothetical protein